MQALTQVLVAAATAGLVILSAHAAGSPMDFGVDGRSDILWRNSSSGENYLYFMNGTQIASEGYLRTVADHDWQVAGLGDFDGDGQTDILWRNRATGENYIYMMSGTQILSEGYLRTVADQDWQVAGVGNFDGNDSSATADILWRNRVTGENYIYMMNGTAIASEGYIRTVADLNWEIVGTGDFNNDGETDILWRNRATGENYIYMMNGTVITSEGYIRTVADLNWEIVGTGDFNGGGETDILWRNRITGENYIYMMNGTVIASEGYLRTVADQNWHVTGVGNFGGNESPATADILWRNLFTGENYIHLMNGTAITSEGYIRTVDDMTWRPLFAPAWNYTAQLPALPQTFIDTTYSPPSGNTIIVSEGDSLQAAINNAQPGDMIVLQAGATFAGPFTLPNKTGPGWIYIQSSAYASLPPPGTRVTPADAINMPKIQGSSNVIQTAPQAHNYRFVGIEFRPAPGEFVTTLIKIGDSETSVTDLPRDITFDRCYVHGLPDLAGRRGIAMNGASIAVVDSHVSDFKEVDADSQALWTYNSPGPLKIVNNFLEAAGENFMSGGGDPSIANLVPSDIEIRRNHFFKPLAWMNTPLDWTVKNLIEFKNARRVLVEGNIFENTWFAGQVGALVNAGPSPEGPDAAWTTVEDLTFRYNKGINLEVGVQINGRGGDPYDAQIMKRVLIEHNVLQVTRPNDGDGWIFQIGGGPMNLTIRHNTALITDEGGAAFSENSSAPADRFDFRDNLLSRGDSGFAGTSEDEGIATLNRYYTNYTFIKNAIISAPSGSYPANNFFPANATAVGFVDYANGNYRLSASSPLKNQASDGQDVGADIDAVEAAVAGVIKSF